MIAAWLGGRSVELVALNLGTDIDSFCLSCEATLAEPADWRAAWPGAELRIEAAGACFTFLVDNRLRERRFGEESWRLVARSPASRLDAPFAAPLSQTWTATTARTLAQEICEQAGIALDWRIVDFPIQEYVAERKTPLAILTEIKTEAAALLSKPDGSLVVCWRYPITPERYATSTPATVLSDVDDLLQLDQSYDYRPGYNKVGVLSNSDAGAQDVRLLEWGGLPEGAAWLSGREEAKILPPGQKFVVAATWPSRELELKTSCSMARIFSEPWIEFEMRETIGLERGQGSLSWPAAELLSVSWRCSDLGKLNLDGTSVRAEVSEQSLVELRYRVRLQCWRVSCPDQGKVQCYVEFAAQDPGAGQGVTHVVRWPGDRPAPDLIVDPLCTTQAIAMERGRNWLDDQGYSKERYTARTPSRTFVLPGSLVEVRDASLAERWHGRLTGWHLEAGQGQDGGLEEVIWDLERSLL